MAFTPTLTLPLPSTPEAAFTDLWGLDEDIPSETTDSECSTDVEASTEAFKATLDRRDAHVCVVCHMPGPVVLNHCRIIPEDYHWQFMQSLHYIPIDTRSASREPRNGLLLCLNHAAAFEQYYFYIRWNPETDEFFAVNHSQIGNLESIHGNVLDFKTTLTEQCPFPTVFLWHEARVRAFNPTCGDRLVFLKREDQRGPAEYFSQRHGVGVHRHGVSGGADTIELIETHTATRMEVGSPVFTTWMEAASKSWDGTASRNVGSVLP